MFQTLDVFLVLGFLWIINQGTWRVFFYLREYDEVCDRGWEGIYFGKFWFNCRFQYLGLVSFKLRIGVRGIGRDI